MKVEPGQRIGGKYEIERLLGEGSMGQVWRARHATLEGSYAVKLIDVKRMPDAAGRFQLEAHIASKLSRKTRHIVSVTDHGEDEELAYLVMELLDGQSLEQRLEETEPLSLRQVSSIVTQVGRALRHAHDEGFVHRDIKPANLFLTKDEDGRMLVKVLDFGIARTLTKVATRSPFATAKDTIVGTPSYMSPEQATGQEGVDHRCDLWSLAVVAYEALTRERPFEGETLQDVLISIGIGRQVPLKARRQDLPEAIYAFFDKAFAEAIEERFSSASELATTFERAAGVRSDRPREASRPRVRGEERIEPTTQGGSGWVVVLAVLAAMALIGFVVAMALRRSDGARGRETRGTEADAAPGRGRLLPPRSSASGDPAASSSAAPSEASPSAPAPSARAPSSPSPSPSSSSSSVPSSASARPAATPAPSHSVDRAEVF